MALGGSGPPRLVDPLISAATFAAALLLVGGTIGIGKAPIWQACPGSGPARAQPGSCEGTLLRNCEQGVVLLGSWLTNLLSDVFFDGFLSDALNLC